MFSLPSELQATIYSYDSTFHDEFRKTLLALRHFVMFRKRVRVEFRRLAREDGVRDFVAHGKRTCTFTYEGREGRIRVPDCYPFDPPDLILNNTRIDIGCCWIPTASLYTAVLSCAHAHVTEDL